MARHHREGEGGMKRPWRLEAGEPSIPEHLKSPAFKQGEADFKRGLSPLTAGGYSIGMSGLRGTAYWRGYVYAENRKTWGIE